MRNGNVPLRPETRRVEGVEIAIRPEFLSSNRRRSARDVSLDIARGKPTVLYGLFGLSRGMMQLLR